MRRTLLISALVVCATAAALVYLLDPTPRVSPRQGQPSAQRALLEATRNKPEDSDLGLLFDELNARHFGARLPDVKVVWSSELDSLDEGEYRLNGMTDGRTILLKATFKDDEADVRRTLCHEMVHVKFITAGGRSTAHDDRFQNELRRIFDEGCFPAIWASEAEKASLQEWITAERTRLDTAVAATAAQLTAIQQEETRVQRLIADLNDRIRAANAAGSGWPSAEETAAAERQQIALTDRVSAYNAAVAENESAQTRFNEEVERFNLMAAYPDGLAEDRAKGLIR
jgi:hypothetical protein